MGLKSHSNDAVGPELTYRMACKICAAMPTKAPHPLKLSPLPAVCLSLGLAFAALPAGAEKTDRDKPMVMTGDNSGEYNLESSAGEFVGNVVIGQGTLRLTADRVKWQLPPDGFYRFFAVSTGDKQVEFRQARDTPGEIVVGLADRIEYDTKADSVRLIGHAVMRVLRGALVVKEATSAVLVYDKRSESFKLESSENATQKPDRIRLTILPRDAGAAPPSAAASGVPLQPSTTLQPRKGS